MGRLLRHTQALHPRHRNNFRVFLDRHKNKPFAVHTVYPILRPKKYAGISRHENETKKENPDDCCHRDFLHYPGSDSSHMVEVVGIEPATF